MRAFPRIEAMLLAVLCCGTACGQQPTAGPTWRQIPGDWPETTNQVRAMISGAGELYIGVAGTVANSAQVWRLDESEWVKHAELAPLKVAVLQADPAGNLYVGVGTPHSAEGGGNGDAAVWKIDAGGEKTRLRSFRGRDIAYSMVWFQEQLYVGTMTEDLPGTAEIWRHDDPGWTRIAGNGIDGWGATNSSAAVYEMWVHDGALIAGTFSRTMGDGDVLRLAEGRWANMDAPPTIIPLCFETYQGRLVTALSNAGASHANPVYELRTDGSWQPLGVAPREWKGAYIPNHMVADGTDLYLGVGGARGTLSVWKYDGASWTKLAGDGLFGSWNDPLVNQGAEWVYRLAIHQGKLYVGLASDRAPFRAQVWEMTP